MRADSQNLSRPHSRGLIPLLRPASIAVVGATERAGSYGGEALLNLQRLGYRGRVFAVNPRRASVHGVKAYPALEDLPEAPDAVVVAIPAGDAPDVVARASALGCGGAVVFAAGFAEAQETELQSALAYAAGGLPVCGPNGNGIVSLPDRVALWGDTIEPREPGPVALISQSGNVAVNALASRRGLRLHTVVSCGNPAEDWAAVLEAVNVAKGDVTVASTLPELVSDGAIAGLRSGIRALRPLREPRPLAARVDGGRLLGEAEAKQRLRAAGIPVVEGEVTDDAVATWQHLGGPVAVKLVGVTHKAREDGVVLDLDDEAAIRLAAERLGPTVLVERMAPRGTEVLVAIRRDGLVPVLVVGAGGVHTEQLDDVAVIPLPADEDRITQALKALRTPIPPAPIARLAIALQALPLALIELNPVIVHANEAVVVDALAQEEIHP
jgi:acyl-CoA synthetase (NDP forming)